MNDFIPGLLADEAPKLAVPAFGVPHKSTCTPREAAAAIGVSERQIRNWIDTGELAAISSNKDLEAALRPHWRVIVKLERPFAAYRTKGLSLEEVVERRKSVREE